MRGAPPGGCRCHQQPPGVGLARAYDAFGPIAERVLLASPLGPCRCSRSVPAASPPCAGCARVSVEPLSLHALRVAVAYLAPGGPERDRVAPRPVPPTRPAWCRDPRWGRRDGGRLGLSMSESLAWVGPETVTAEGSSCEPLRCQPWQGGTGSGTRPARGARAAGPPDPARRRRRSTRERGAEERKSADARGAGAAVGRQGEYRRVGR